jgi:hypothetical protein
MTYSLTISSLIMGDYPKKGNLGKGISFFFLYFFLFKHFLKTLQFPRFGESGLMSEDMETEMGKMTQEKVMEMRRLYGEGATQGSLARHFQIGIAQVGRIVRGECWQKGAGARGMTQREIDASLQRILDLEARVRAQKELEAADPLVAEIFGSVASAGKKPPPSPLEGGDAPSTDGSALQRLKEEGNSTVQGLDKVLFEPGGPYDFVKRREEK